MIGLNLPMCVRDIASRLVKLEDVEKIIYSTTARTDKDWEYLISVYSVRYWGLCLDEALKTMDYLLEHGLIDQPQLDGRPLPDPYARLWKEPQHWVESEEEIVWMRK